MRTPFDRTIAGTIALAVVVAVVPLANQVRAQLLTDTLFTWSGYAHESICRVRIYRAAPKERKDVVIVLDELADNRGRSTLDDGRHLAELIAREAAIDPESAYWIFYWGDFSFESAQSSRKEVLLRATFRRSDNGSLGTPSWRLINRETLAKYTDRAFP